jgi:hypothetical protein
MPAPEEFSYRLRLVLGFLEEARQDFNLGRWRSCVDNSQLVTENEAKAVLALLGPVGARTTPPCFCEKHLQKGNSLGKFHLWWNVWQSALSFWDQTSICKAIMVTRPAGVLLGSCSTGAQPGKL